MRARFLHLAALTLALLLSACHDQPPPIKIGFLAAMSGPQADFGLVGRNGALLAIEQRNAAGGVKGRQIDLLVRDDAQDPKLAVQAVRELAAADVALIIGPMISSISAAVTPVAAQFGLVMISPTASATSLAGHDDNMFRLAATSQSYADLAATFFVKHLGLRRIATVYDAHNHVYSKLINDEFQAALQAQGGEVVLELPFDSTAAPRFSELAKTLISSQAQAILLISTAVDTVRLAQQIRRQQADIPLMTTVWAATDALVELGGRDIEGLYVVQPFNRMDTTPRYQEFLKTYRQRFGIEPGYVGVASYDAANVAMDALAQQAPGQPLKSVLLNGSFTGVQQPIRFDRFGDAPRGSVIVMVHDGAFVMTYNPSAY